ncbi:MAG: hypothetical protein AAF604_23230 [Acidobacteriota bacterium]
MKRPWLGSILAVALLALTLSVGAQPEFWKATPDSEGVCDFLEDVYVFSDRKGESFICADWITESGPEVTCCIPESALAGGDREACETIISTPSTDDRPGL